MRTRHYLLSTLKETPADAEIISHQLMLRAGLIRKLASGLYTWLPTGLRVLQKVSQIVREEMEKIGALEILMPSIQPAELWEETGRWKDYGPHLLKMQDRHDRPFCYGPTHEEVVTDLIRKELQSYKSLPLTVYQIQTKFRDEIRPRFGVMRAREFVMKDAYSFHTDKASLQITYEHFYQAYSRIFERLGLTFRAVLADTGSIGGSYSHEFQVLADSGEDLIAYSDSSNYTANIELASALAPTQTRLPAKETCAKVATPGCKTISAVAEYLKKPENACVKTLFVVGREHPLVALLVRGDHEVNPLKAEKHPLVASPFNLADPVLIKDLIGAEPGSLGPVGLSEKGIPLIADRDVVVLADFIGGANENDYHYTGLNWGRDCPEALIADLRFVVAGDRSPDGEGTLSLTRGIEVGHIFQLGQKYAEAMKATVLNEEGESIILEMGCYGIGVSRIVGAAIEQHHDEEGIVWPSAMAPFQVGIVPINYHRSDLVKKATETIYAELKSIGLEVLLDDREERPGVMFADMALLGIPHRVVVSEKSLAQGQYEYKCRKTGTIRQLSKEELIQTLSAATGMIAHA